MKRIADVVWDARGLVPVIVQDAGTGTVLALDLMDQAALATTLATGRATYCRMRPGASESCAAQGPVQMITAVHLACNGQAILLKVQTQGAVCRTGQSGCFEQKLLAGSLQENRGIGSMNRYNDVIIEWLPEAAEGA